MVVALSVVGTSVVDSHSSPCLCVDALTSTNVNQMSSGDLSMQRKSMTSSVQKHLRRRGALELSSSFVGSRLPVKALYTSKKQRKGRGLTIVNELAGQYEDSFGDVKIHIVNLFTYKAVRTVMNQLYEMNPTQYRWFYDFVATNKPSDGKHFLRLLAKEKQDLAERVMVTRLHLYGKWIKKCDHGEMYKEISDQNLELMRERLLATVIWPSEGSDDGDTATETIG